MIEVVTCILLEKQRGRVVAFINVIGPLIQGVTSIYLHDYTFIPFYNFHPCFWCWAHAGKWGRTLQIPFKPGFFSLFFSKKLTQTTGNCLIRKLIDLNVSHLICKK